MQLVVANSYFTLPLQELPFVLGQGDLVIQELLVPAISTLSPQVKSGLQQLRRLGAAACQIDLVIEVNALFSEPACHEALKHGLSLIQDELARAPISHCTLSGWLVYAKTGEITQLICSLDKPSTVQHTLDTLCATTL